MRTHFSTPVDKNHEGLQDPSRHLTWYALEKRDPPDVERTVEVTNQFGVQTLRLGQPVYLLTPTEKKEEGSRFPADLDHYECYEVLSGDAPVKTVSLEDQFGLELRVEVGTPKYFCVPVEKVHDNIVTRVKYPEVHLTVYEVRAAGRRIDDQILPEMQPLRFDSCEMLCVPSEKRLVVGQAGHFKVFEISPNRIGPIEIQLKGQFDPDFKGLTVQSMTHFSVPVSKNQEPIPSANNYFTWFNLEGAVEEPQRVVEIDNQFGKQTLVVARARYLVAPAQNLLPPRDPPKGLDHYKCYEIVQANPPTVGREVFLEDTLGANEAVPVGAPKFFCVPVEKIHANVRVTIQQPLTHLTFYEITSDRSINGGFVNDQFGRRDFGGGRCVLLGVPTQKLSVTPQ